MSVKKQKMRPREVAREYGVSVDKVLAWIRAGELPAINGATTQTGRPRFLISRADLERFEVSRAVVPPPEPAPRRRRKDPADVQYF